MVAKRHYDVVCGIIMNERDQLLIGLRDFAADQGGLWEFPGGKVELGEEEFDALCRELAEEIGIEVVEAEPWVQVDHEYPNYHVSLYAWKVLEYEGEIDSVEGQLLRWVDLEKLPTLRFPEANLPIIEELLSSNAKLEKQGS